MEFFNKPENLNGAELRQELRDAGVDISDKFDAVMVNDKTILALDIDSKHRSIAEKVVKNHSGTVIGKEPTVAEKLASVGLNLDDLKAALGL